MLIYNELGSDFTCGSEPCYKKSKREKQVCRRIFDNDGVSIFDHFSSNLAISTVLPLILVPLVVFIVASAVSSYVLRDYSQGSKSAGIFRVQIDSSSSNL